MPALSTPRTRKTCAPFFSPLYVLGDEQASHAPPSRRHWNLAPPSEDEKPKVADFEPVDAFGPDVIVVLGATVSTLHVRCAGEWSRVPLASFARTRKVCLPCGREE